MRSPEIFRADERFAVATCGHDAPPRRVCDVCKTARYAFTACSNACLRAHQTAAHDRALAADSAIRARRALAERNRSSPDSWHSFAAHRSRLTALLLAEAAGGTLCVLGAGKCDDLDLPRLARHFAEIHLVDLDGEAMERARDRQPSAVRDAMVLHGAIDLSGFLGRLDDWGEAFPDDDTLHQAACRAVRAGAEQLGGPFDVTLSSCTLSQLIVPFQIAWTASESTWRKLEAALTAAHVGLVASLTVPAGSASLVVDVLSSNEAPALTGLRGHATEELQAVVRSWTRSGAVALQPDPVTLLNQIRSSGIAAEHPEPRLLGPWLWDTGAAFHLVYALNFRRV